MFEHIASPEFVQLSLTPILIGVLASIACALPGNFLLLRRQALIGDAISHVVLPGIVGAFLIFGSLSAWPMLIGAALAALIAVAFIEAVKRLGNVEAGAAMGVVFTIMFAAGVLFLEISNAGSAHIDVEHALMGNLESLIWIDAFDGWPAMFDPQARAGLPPELARLAIVALIVSLLTIVFWRPLAISSFDEAYAKAIGLPTTLISVGLVVAAALAAVAAFDAVGSLLVIAMFICPPAAARLVTNQLARQLWWSVLFAIISAVAGYVLAGYGPLWFGLERAVSAAGMIAVISGVILGLAALLGPARSRLSAG